MKGGWQYSRGTDLSWTATLSGQVSEEGRLSASGPASFAGTVGDRTFSASGTYQLTGDISGEEFVGTATADGSDGSMEFKATRQ